jgi:hypothetical protein
VKRHGLSCQQLLHLASNSVRDRDSLSRRQQNDPLAVSAESQLLADDAAQRLQAAQTAYYSDILLIKDQEDDCLWLTIVAQNAVS